MCCLLRARAWPYFGSTAPPGTPVCRSIGPHGASLLQGGPASLLANERPPQAIL